MSDILDPDTMKVPLLSQEVPIDPESLVIEDDTSEKWRKRANAQIDSLARVFCSIAVLAILGIIWVCFVTIVNYEEGLWPIDGIAILVYFGGALVFSTVLSVFVQRRIQKNEETAVVDDCKDAKKKRKDEKRRRLVALWFFFVALWIVFRMILDSVSNMQGPHHQALYEYVDISRPSATLSRTISVTVPPGKVGFILANEADSKGAFVSAVRLSRELAKKIHPGDRIIAIDGKDVSRMSVWDINSLMDRKSKFERELTLIPRHDGS